MTYKTHYICRYSRHILVSYISRLQLSIPSQIRLLFKNKVGNEMKSNLMKLIAGIVLFNDQMAMFVSEFVYHVHTLSRQSQVAGGPLSVVG